MAEYLRISLKRERKRVFQANKRAMDKGLRANLTLFEWGMILATFNYRCAYCGQPYEVMDHVLPMLNGGGTTATNVVPCCTACNQRKDTAVWLPARVGGIR